MPRIRSSGREPASFTKRSTSFIHSSSAARLDLREMNESLWMELWQDCSFTSTPTTYTGQDLLSMLPALEAKLAAKLGDGSNPSINGVGSTRNKAIACLIPITKCPMPSISRREFNETRIAT